MQSIDVFLHVPDNLFYEGEIKGLAMFFNPTLETLRNYINLPLYYTGLEERAIVVYEEHTTFPVVHQLNRDFSIDLLIGNAPISCKRYYKLNVKMYRQTIF